MTNPIFDPMTYWLRGHAAGYWKGVCWGIPIGVVIGVVSIGLISVAVSAAWIGASP